MPTRSCTKLPPAKKHAEGERSCRITSCQAQRLTPSMHCVSLKSRRSGLRLGRLTFLCADRQTNSLDGEHAFVVIRFGAPPCSGNTQFDAPDSSADAPGYRASGCFSRHVPIPTGYRIWGAPAETKEIVAHQLINQNPSSSYTILQGTPLFKLRFICAAKSGRKKKTVQGSNRGPCALWQCP